MTRQVVGCFHWQFDVHTVDGRNPANHLGCIEPCKSCDVYVYIYILYYRYVSTGAVFSQLLNLFQLEVTPGISATNCFLPLALLGYKQQIDAEREG